MTMIAESNHLLWGCANTRQPLYRKSAFWLEDKSDLLPKDIHRVCCLAGLLVAKAVVWGATAAALVVLLMDNGPRDGGGDQGRHGLSWLQGNRNKH